MKTLRYIALAALTLSFVACEQEDINPAVQGDPDAVKINATIGNMQTRVAYGENGATTFTSGDAFKVVNTMRSTKNEATYTTTDGTNWTTTDAMVWNSTSKNKFQAWYPVAEYSSYDAFTIPTDQSDATKLASADWMTASTEEIDKPGNGVLDLSFHHRLAKVTVNLTFSSQYPVGNQYVSKFTFLTNEETPQKITALANSETSYTAILRPGEYADEDDFIYLEMDGIDEHDVPGKTTTSAINLEAGKHYTFTLKVGKDVVSISSVSVADWNEEEIDGGVAEEVFPSIDGTDYASLSALQNAVKEKFSDEDVTSVTLDGNVSDEVHAAVISAIGEVKTVGAVTNGYLWEGSVTYTVYEDFTNATATWTDGMTLTMLGNATDLTKYIKTTAKGLVLDLNGHTLASSATLCTIWIDGDSSSELTIRDTKGGGYVQGNVYAVASPSGMSKLCLESGTVESVDANGDFTMTGGTIRNENGDALNTSSDLVKIVVSGGEIYSSKYAIYSYTVANIVVTGTAKLTGVKGIIDDRGVSNFTVTGGIFSHDPSEWVDQDAYTVTENSDGTWSVTAKE